MDQYQQAINLYFELIGAFPRLSGQKAQKVQ
jgi:hypothetical protein